MWHCLWVIPLYNKYSEVSKYQKTKHSKEITQDLIMTHLFQILLFTYVYISVTMTSFQRQSYMGLSNTSLPTQKLRHAHAFLFQYLFVWVYMHGVFVSWLEESTLFRDTGCNKVKEQWLPLSMFPVAFQSLWRTVLKPQNETALSLRNLGRLSLKSAQRVSTEPGRWTFFLSSMTVWLQHPEDSKITQLHLAPVGCCSS